MCVVFLVLFVCLRLPVDFLTHTTLIPPQSVLCVGVVYMGGTVYAVGGFNGSLRVRTVDAYDPVKDEWCCVSSMQDRRSTLGAAVLNGLLYAVGGFDGSTGEGRDPGECQ